MLEEPSVKTSCIVTSNDATAIRLDILGCSLFCGNANACTQSNNSFDSKKISFESPAVGMKIEWGEKLNTSKYSVVWLGQKKLKLDDFVSFGETKEIGRVIELYEKKKCKLAKVQATPGSAGKDFSEYGSDYRPGSNLCGQGGK